MQQPIAGQDVAGLQRAGFAGKAADPAAGLPHNQHPGGNIIEVQTRLNIEMCIRDSSMPDLWIRHQ